MISAARVFIGDGDGKYLCLFQNKWGGWIVPGGKAEPGETPEQCIARETLEEVGLAISNIRLIHSNLFLKDEYWEDFMAYYFAADADFGAAKIIEPTKHSEISMRTLAQLRDDDRYIQRCYDKIKELLENQKNIK